MKTVRTIKSSVTNLPFIIIPNSSNYAYANDEKADEIDNTLEVQFRGKAIFDYETEQEVRNVLSKAPPPLDIFNIMC